MSVGNSAFLIQQIHSVILLQVQQLSSSNVSLCFPAQTGTVFPRTVHWCQPLFSSSPQLLGLLHFHTISNSERAPVRRSLTLTCYVRRSLILTCYVRWSLILTCCVRRSLTLTCYVRRSLILTCCVRRNLILTCCVRRSLILTCYLRRA